jgi:hypothetical protein
MSPRQVLEHAVLAGVALTTLVVGAVQAAPLGDQAAAVASLTWQGKTYRFTGGACLKAGSTGRYTASIGRQPRPFLQVLAPRSAAGRYRTGLRPTAQVTWRISGKSFALDEGGSFTISSKLTSGTFTGPVYGGLPANPQPGRARGSWSCPNLVPAPGG